MVTSSGPFLFDVIIKVSLSVLSPQEKEAGD